MKKLWTKDFFLLIFTASMVFMASSMMNSPLPRYAMQLGGNNTAAGLVTGLFALSSCICRPIFGRLLDKKGRQFILLAGIFFYGALTLSYNLAGTVTVLLALRFLQGAGMSAYSTSLGTITADLLPAERIVEGYGYYSLVQTVAGSIGPMLGLGLIAGSSYHQLFWLTAAFSAAGFLIALFLRYEKKRPVPMVQHESAEPPQTGKKPGLFEKSAIPTAVAVFFASITTGAVMTFLSPYAATRGIESIGVYFTVNAAVLFLSRLVLSRLTRWLGTSGVVALGLVLMCASMALLCVSSSMSLFLIAAVVNGMGAGVLFPVFNSIVVSICPTGRRGAANGTYYIGIDVGIGAGSVLGGVIAQAAGYPTLYAISAASVVVAFLVFRFVVKRQLKPHRGDAAAQGQPAEGVH